MSTVSVVIPTYNRAALVCDAIESVLAQSYQDFEIIVADDSSTDDTAARVAQYGARVRFLPLPHRGQPAATRNGGLAVATGEYVTFLDSDDLFLPDKLALQVPILQANPATGLVYSNGYYFDDSPTKAEGSALDGLPTPSGEIFAELLRGNFIMTPALALLRRELVVEAGGFDESAALIAVEDYDLWLRLAVRTQVHYVPGHVAAIRRHANNLSADILRHRQRILALYARLAQQMPDTIAQHKPAQHEAYLRNHGAIAALALRQRRWPLAARHATLALWHLLHLPKLGRDALREMRTRRQLRGM